MFRVLGASLLIFSSLAWAETKTFTVKGMHCQSCVETLKAEVCALPKLDTCEIELGKMTLVSKEKIDVKSVEKAVEKAGTIYKITEVKN